MLKYIVQRIIAMIPTLAMILIFGFILIELPPGDYLTYRLSQLQLQGYTGAEEEIEMLRRRYALDKPAYERFVNWVAHFAQGDFGESFQYMKPVKEIIGERLLMSVILSITSMIIVWTLGLFIGVYSATHQYSFGDHFFTGLAFLGLGMPGFLLALIFLLVGLRLMGEVPIGLLSAEYISAPWSMAKVGNLLQHLWIPAAIVALSSTAGLMRVMRGNLLDTLRMAYVQVARAKGLEERTVIWKYAVRTAMHPLIMSLGASLPGLVSGEQITGMVLNLPTTGPLYLQALQVQDMYVAGTMLILISMLLVIGNLLADILLAWLDPRIRLG